MAVIVSGWIASLNLSEKGARWPKTNGKYLVRKSSKKN
jgi:hypothetical protein